MPSPKCVFVSLLLAALALPCLADGPAAVENPTFPIDPVKAGAEVLIKNLAEMGYNTNCKAKNLDYASDDSWYCGLFAKISGAKETEWKERLVHRLGAVLPGEGSGVRGRGERERGDEHEETNAHGREGYS